MCSLPLVGLRCFTYLVFALVCMFVPSLFECGLFYFTASAYQNPLKVFGSFLRLPKNLARSGVKYLAFILAIPYRKFGGSWAARRRQTGSQSLASSLTKCWLTGCQMTDWGLTHNCRWWLIMLSNSWRSQQIEYFMRLMPRLGHRVCTVPIRTDCQSMQTQYLFVGSWVATNNFKLPIVHSFSCYLRHESYASSTFLLGFSIRCVVYGCGA